MNEDDYWSLLFENQTISYTFAMLRLYNLSQFTKKRNKIDKYNNSQRISNNLEVKIDVHRWRGMEQLMMGLPRAPKSRPARPAVRLQPPKLKVKIKDML